jgi:hypothetical protein
MQCAEGVSITLGSTEPLAQGGSRSNSAREVATTKAHSSQGRRDDGSHPEYAAPMRALVVTK